MNILVTGGNGFIGSNLINRLISDEHSVTSLDDLSAGLREYEVMGCRYIYGDIEQLIYWNDEKYDICFHLAALSRIQPSFENPHETFRVNAGGTQIVAEWARMNNVKVIYAGSSSKWTDSTISPYATYKEVGENIIKMYRRVYDCNFEIVRFYNVYGPNELVDSEQAALLGVWRNRINNNEPLIIVGDGEQRRDFTHVDDIIDGLIKIAFSDEKHEDAWELGTGYNYSINEVYDMFKNRFNNIEKINIPQQKGNYPDSLRHNDDVLKRLNWQPKDRLNKYIQSL